MIEQKTSICERVSQLTQREQEQRKVFPINDTLYVYPDLYEIQKYATLLSDGTVIKIGDTYGRLIIEPPRLQPEEQLLTYTKRLKQQIESGLSLLASACQNVDELQPIHVFGGYSHLAKLGKAYGFDTFYIYDGEAHEHIKKSSFAVVTRTVGSSPLWQSFNQKPTLAQEALISREKLIQLYGNNT